MISESLIREQIGRYLRGELSLDRFEDWIAQNSWNMHKDSDEPSQRLASAVELRLAEHSSEHLDEDSLREELRQLVNPKVVEISFGDALPALSQEAPNNVVAKANYQMFSFKIRAEENPEATQLAAGFAGTAQSVAHV
jgi:hypothetical protein